MSLIEELLRRELEHQCESSCGCAESGTLLRVLHAIEFHLSEVATKGPTNTVAAIMALFEAQPGTLDADHRSDANLQLRLQGHVRRWLEASAKGLRHDDLDYAQIKITATQPSWDEDDTCCVELQIVETRGSDELSGRVEGVK